MSMGGCPGVDMGGSRVENTVGAPYWGAFLGSWGLFSCFGDWGVQGGASGFGVGGVCRDIGSCLVGSWGGECVDWTHVFVKCRYRTYHTVSRHNVFVEHTCSCHSNIHCTTIEHLFTSVTHNASRYNIVCIDDIEITQVEHVCSSYDSIIRILHQYSLALVQGSDTIPA